LRARFDPLIAALILLAGLLVGFAGSTLAYRYGWLCVPARGIVERMDRELDLTTAQHQQVVEVMENTRLKMMQMRHDFRRQRSEVFKQAADRIRAILTPEQQKEFDKSFRLEREAGRGPPGIGRPEGP
jgi:Spy/CpxP family protein refolding chaperone